MGTKRKLIAQGFVSVLVTILAGVFAQIAIYNIWRNYQSIGVHEFTTTGKVWVKKIRERSGSSRRNNKIVYRPYAEYMTIDKHHRYEREILDTQRQNINNGIRYSQVMTVLVDRYGESKVVLPEKAKQQPVNIVMSVIFSGVFIVGMYFSIRSWIRLRALNLNNHRSSNCIVSS